jgi:hypothetical protein
MKKAVFIFSSQFCAVLLFGQALITPNDPSINKSLIKQGKFTMGYYVVKEDKATEICLYETEVKIDNQKFNLNTSLNFLQSNLRWKETVVADANTLKTFSRNSQRDTRSFSLAYSDKVSGEKTDKSGKKSRVNFSLSEPFFDIALYPYVICALPLTTGYKAIIPVVDLDANEKINKVLITEVKSSVFNSELTGDHNVWKVSVLEESTGHIYNYYIDKETRKLYRVDISANGTVLFLLDKETDYNPFKTQFDKEATLRMVTGGSSVIFGEAYAREAMTDISILGSNKKQVAAKGTRVLLMPYTAYYKEWFEINKKQAKVKNAKPIQLPKEAKECILFTEVYDDKGHFEFTNLMPGEYLLFTTFGYEETFLKREITGGADKYINGHYAGSEVYSDVFEYSRNAAANAMKTFTIKSNGEKLNIKLRNAVKFRPFAGLGK